MVDERITKAKIKLGLEDRFLGALAMMLEWREENSIDTMATNGKEFIYNKDFLDKLEFKELLGVMAHECMHVALAHNIRCYNGKFEPELYNIAGDYAINQTLVEHNFILPEGALISREFRGLCTEEIYAILEKNGNNNSQNNSNGNNQGKNKGKGSGGGNKKYPMQGDILKPASDADIEKVKRNIITAKLSASEKDFSCASAEFQRNFTDITNPKLPWNVILRRYVNSTVNDDYSWKRPNRRFQDVYLPSLCDGDALTKLNVYMDVSGSVDDKTVGKFLTEIKGFYDNLAIEVLTINTFSTRLNQKIVMTDSWKPVSNNLESFGGTCIGPVIEDINNNKAVVNIIFTDGYFDESPIQQSKYPIVWVIYDNNNFKPAKGKVVEIRV